MSNVEDYPFSAPSVLTTSDPVSGLYPVGVDASPVRLDPSHSGWSDIFFLGMDFPEGARVINISVDLSVHGSNEPILPPCECYCRYIEEPVILLSSLDLKSAKKIASLEELFNFGNDYLSLLKAGVVASGLIPPCFEKRDIPLALILKKLLGKAGGIEIVTKVHGIPKGSRLAVSTTLLATIITRLMRFSGQIRNQTGPLNNDDRRIVASRAILGEWLGGSGGGWQDSGGLWPGFKVITGQFAEEGHPEHGISSGCLLPRHDVLTKDELPQDIEEKILDSLVLVHGGLSQDVGPILEMVTEKYLLKYETEWNARLRGIQLFDKIVDAMKSGNMKELGRLTTEDWEESIKKVIPGVNNSFTEDMISQVKKEFNDNYWGFLMLGGMSGGGMAFIVNPEIKVMFKNRIADIMMNLSEKYRWSLPFIITPVVYDFAINHSGIVSRLLEGREATIPDAASVSTLQTDSAPMSSDVLDEDEMRERYGFDMASHEYMKDKLRRGEIGLTRNRLPRNTDVDDIPNDAMKHYDQVTLQDDYQNYGLASLKRSEIAVVSFAGGMGSRWTHGAAVVKPINPFVHIDGKFRTFIECHIAKSRKSSSATGAKIPHIFTTSYLTHEAIDTYLKDSDYFKYRDSLYLSPGKSIAHRVYPMERDLRFYWEEQLQQKEDENIQKVHDDLHSALIQWTKSQGEGGDYIENRPVMRFNPPGHWYEIPNLIKNGTLARVLIDNPGIQYLLCHNIDTMGAYIDPCLLGLHIQSEASLTFEVTPRRIEDAGGGLAMINGHIRLVEGMALPRDEDEFKLRYYNTLTNWITIDLLLDYFGLTRDLLADALNDNNLQKKVNKSIQEIEKKMPTYVTIKNVKHLWGSGQEDIYPVAQFEKLWGDMTGLRDLKTGFIAVPRHRGLQLKEPSLLDVWVHDGSLDYLKSKTLFNS
jgi:galactokinase/mevalonate kinase-like predicted kinase